MEMSADLFWSKYHRASQALVDKGLVTLDGSGEPNVAWLLEVTAKLGTGELKLVEVNDEKSTSTDAGASGVGRLCNG